MKIDPKTFCAAPWFHVRNMNDGSFRACCEIDPASSLYKGDSEYNLREHSIEQWRNSGYNQYLKQNLTLGQRLEECRRCWSKEDSGHRSLRQIINSTVTKNASDLQQTWLRSYFNRKADWVSDLLLSADVKISNLCNFACAMCNPMDSSQIYTVWHQNLDHPIVQEILHSDPGYLDRARAVFLEKNNIRLLQEILAMDPRHLKILGGEPLMDQDLRQNLAAVPAERASRINLLFVTNGSQDLCGARQQLDHYATVSFVVSLEGTGATQDFVRRGSNWAIINSNIQRYVQTYGTANLYVQHTLQALSIPGLPDLLHWCASTGLTIGLSQLEKPHYLALTSLPPRILHSIADRLIANPVELTSPPYFDDPHVDLQGLIRTLKTVHHDADGLARLREFLSWYDPDKRWPYLELIGPISE